MVFKAGKCLNVASFFVNHDKRLSN